MIELQSRPSCGYSRTRRSRFFWLGRTGFKIFTLPATVMSGALQQVLNGMTMDQPCLAEKYMSYLWTFHFRQHKQQAWSANIEARLRDLVLRCACFVRWT